MPNKIPQDTKVGYLVTIGKTFAETATEGATMTKEIMAVPYDAWDHPMFGMTVFDRTMAETMKLNFDQNVRGQDIATDYDHGLDPAKGGKASGWLKSMRVGDDALYWTVEFTEEATKEIKSGEWRYFSPEWFDSWTNPMLGGGTYSYVAVGGALTNKPWIKGMVPLNFSEVMVEKEGASMKYAKFEKDGNEVAWVSEDDGVTWRFATDDELKNESVEWEHSEPGTGSPPEPREDDSDRSGRRGEGDGIRVDDPLREPTDTKEGSEVKFDKEFLASIGIDDENLAEDKVKEHIALAFSELAPLREAAKKVAEARKFSEDYPEEYAEMQRLKAESLETASRKFSERYERLNVRVGDETKKSTKGFSALVLDKIALTHKRFSEGAAKDEQLKAFSELMDALADENSILDYGETGTANAETNDELPTDPTEVQKQFAEKVQEVCARDNVDWDSGIKKVLEENPELAKRYHETRRPQRA